LHFVDSRLSPRKLGHKDESCQAKILIARFSRG
jgi:hypothetical protein